MTNHIVGALAALGSAFLWALSAILFQQLGRNMSAAAMNFTKGIIAIFCMLAFVLFNGMAEINLRSLLLLGASGILGICLGDTLYFLTLMRLGSRVTLLLGSLIPMVTALLAAILLHESITPAAMFGIMLTICGVTFVLWQRVDSTFNIKNFRIGVVFGILFVIANASAIIFTKIGVKDVPAIDATLVRTMWAVAGLAVWGGFTQSFGRWIRPIADPIILKRLIIAAVIGAFFGTWLSVLALKFTHTAIAATLNSTSPLFVLPLSRWIMNEKISFRAIIGASIAVLGIGVYFFSLTG